MYTLCLKKDFSARHYLIGGDWGDENHPHAHDYKLELRLSAAELDRHEYLVDLVDVETHIDDAVAGFRDSMLNDAKSFAGRNPSLELFARILWDDLHSRLEKYQLSGMVVRLWEHDSAWAQWSGQI